MSSQSVRAAVVAVAVCLFAARSADPGVATSLRPASQDLTSPCNFSTSERIVATGDVHGAFDKYVAILQEAGIIDQRRRWAGGRATFVQLGDVLDRGDDSRKVLDLIRDLEDQATRAGGRVLFLLGNHEVMRMLGDLRYVSEGEYAAFRTSGSEDLRDRLYSVVSERARDEAKAAGTEFDERAYRRQFLEDVPLGRIEMQRAFLPEGEYGKWLRQHDVMARINGIVFLHGGVSPAVAPRGCEGITKETRQELADTETAAASPAETLIAGADGPLWYRGLVDGTATEADIDAVLTALDARAIVVGHTVTTTGRIGTHWGGRVIAVDTGMLGGTFYPGGEPSALEIQGTTRTAIYLGRREPLDGGATGK